VSEAVQIDQQIDRAVVTRAEEPEAQEAEEQAPDQYQAKIKKQNQENASLRARLKELEPLAKKAQELEEAGRSDLEKLTARAEQAERDAAQARQEAIRFRVLSEVPLPSELHEFVFGDNEDEVRARAEKLRAQLPKPDGRPKGDVDQGVRHKSTPANPQQADLEQIRADLAASHRK
jgi:multidrug efflux pump subunit AcrA (membrane-fusion protein)